MDGRMDASSISQCSCGLSTDCPFVPCQAGATSRAQLSPDCPLGTVPTWLHPLGCIWACRLLRRLGYDWGMSNKTIQSVCTHTHTKEKYQHTGAGSKALTHILLKDVHTNQENMHVVLETKRHKYKPPKDTHTHTHTPAGAPSILACFSSPLPPPLTSSPSPLLNSVDGLVNAQGLGLSQHR